MKRKSKFTFFELKVTFYFDLFRFFIGGMYDEKDKSVHLSLIPFFVIKFENAKYMIKSPPVRVEAQEVDKANMKHLDKKLEQSGLKKKKAKK